MTLITKCKDIANDIYNELGSGWSEGVYHKAFEIALRLNNIKYESHRDTTVFYKGYSVGESEIDLLLEDNGEHLVVELKAEPHLRTDMMPQPHKYMKALKINNSLLINFLQESSRAHIECETTKGLEFVELPSKEKNGQ
jgi:GxxExxY protein